MLNTNETSVNSSNRIVNDNGNNTNNNSSYDPEYRFSSDRNGTGNGNVDGNGALFVNSRQGMQLSNTTMTNNGGYKNPNSYNNDNNNNVPSGYEQGNEYEQGDSHSVPYDGAGTNGPAQQWQHRNNMQPQQRSPLHAHSPSFRPPYQGNNGHGYNGGYNGGNNNGGYGSNYGNNGNYHGQNGNTPRDRNTQMASAVLAAQQRHTDEEVCEFRQKQWRLLRPLLLRRLVLFTKNTNHLKPTQANLRAAMSLFGVPIIAYDLISRPLRGTAPPGTFPSRRTLDNATAARGSTNGGWDDGSNSSTATPRSLDSTNGRAVADLVPFGEDVDVSVVSSEPNQKNGDTLADPEIAASTAAIIEASAVGDGSLGCRTSDEPGAQAWDGEAVSRDSLGYWLPRFASILKTLLESERAKVAKASLENQSTVTAGTGSREVSSSSEENVSNAQHDENPANEDSVTSESTTSKTTDSKSNDGNKTIAKKENGPITLEPEGTAADLFHRVAGVCLAALTADMLAKRYYKIKRCPVYERTGSCARELNCDFAHGEMDRRHPTEARESRYRTKLCRTWVSTCGNYCPHQDMCAFAHGVQELRIRLPATEREVKHYIETSVLALNSELAQAASARAITTVRSSTANSSTSASGASNDENSHATDGSSSEWASSNVGVNSVPTSESAEFSSATTVSIASNANAASASLGSQSFGALSTASAGSTPTTLKRFKPSLCRDWLDGAANEAIRRAVAHAGVDPAPEIGTFIVDASRYGCLQCPRGDACIHAHGLAELRLPSVTDQTRLVENMVGEGNDMDSTFDAPGVFESSTLGKREQGGLTKREQTLILIASGLLTTNLPRSITQRVLAVSSAFGPERMASLPILCDKLPEFSMYPHSLALALSLGLANPVSHVIIPVAAQIIQGITPAPFLSAAQDAAANGSVGPPRLGLAKMISMVGSEAADCALITALLTLRAVSLELTPLTIPTSIVSSIDTNTASTPADVTVAAVELLETKARTIIRRRVDLLDGRASHVSGHNHNKFSSYGGGPAVGDMQRHSNQSMMRGGSNDGMGPPDGQNSNQIYNDGGNYSNNNQMYNEEGGNYGRRGMRQDRLSSGGALYGNMGNVPNNNMDNRGPRTTGNNGPRGYGNNRGNNGFNNSGYINQGYNNNGYNNNGDMNFNQRDDGSGNYGYNPSMNQQSYGGDMRNNQVYNTGNNYRGGSNWSPQAQPPHPSGQPQQQQQQQKHIPYTNNNSNGYDLTNLLMLSTGTNNSGLMPLQQQPTTFSPNEGYTPPARSTPTTNNNNSASGWVVGTSRTSSSASFGSGGNISNVGRQNTSGPEVLDQSPLMPFQGMQQRPVGPTVSRGNFNPYAGNAGTYGTNLSISGPSDADLEQVSKQLSELGIESTSSSSNGYLPSFSAWGNSQ
jgi:Zinc finger C-x8-C-x5-C-x3-H type (and similar)